MNFLKSFWGGKHKDSPQQQQQQQQQHQQPQAAKPKRARGNNGTGAHQQAHAGAREPVLQDATEGGVQGLKWYAERQRQDDDGDVADEFYEEQDHSVVPKDVKSVAPSAVRVADVSHGSVILTHHNG